MSPNPHFVRPETWADAAALVDFDPIELTGAEGYVLSSLAVHIRDHRLRDLDSIDRSLEAHFGGFSFSQQKRSSVEAAGHQARDVSYGPSSQVTWIHGNEARVYELGPEPEPDDIDGRMPAVVVWSAGDMFYLLASGELEAAKLVRIAEGLDSGT